MSEHGTDAVVARLLAEDDRLNAMGIALVLQRLKPGDRLPGGLVVMSLNDLDDAISAAASGPR